MNSLITQKEFNEVIRKLKKLPEGLEAKERRRILRKAARPVRNAARSRVPKRTGNLKQSISIMTFRRAKNAVFVGIRLRKGKRKGRDGFYGKFVEYGTEKQRAQPFMRPTADDSSVQQEAIKIVTDEVAKIITANIKKAL